MKQIILAVLVILTLLSNCSSRGRDFPIARASYETGKTELKAYPDEVTAKISETDVIGSVVIKNVLGITITGFFDSQKNEAPLVLNQVELEKYAQSAVARAMQSAKADGLLVTRITRKQKGFWPIYYVDTYEVRGKPVKFESLGTLSAKRVELRRYLQYQKKKEVVEESWFSSINPFSGLSFFN